MTEPTPEEQRLAQKRLDEAVEEWLKSNGFKGICTGWVLVGHMHDVDNEDGSLDLSSYPIAMMGESLPDHVALGLLDVGVNFVRGTGRWATMYKPDDE